MVEYIDSLQKKNAEALSFYPKQVFEREKEEDGTWANARECWNVSDNDTGKVWTFTQVMDAAAA